MIPVIPKLEPQGFDTNVRQRGQKFLATNPKPSSKEFKSNSYWKSAIDDLYAAYGGICAYTCMYFHRPGSVDHFLPKSRYPHLAYEWTNFRLATHRVNLHKGDSTDVVDPFIVQPGWFVLDFPSCLIHPGDGLSAVVAEQVENTIQVLKLNKDDVFVQERCDLMLEFAEGHVDLDFLSKRYPLLAAEIVRQGVQNTANTLFKRRSF